MDGHAWAEKTGFLLLMVAFSHLYSDISTISSMGMMANLASLAVATRPPQAHAHSLPGVPSIKCQVLRVSGFFFLVGCVNGLHDVIWPGRQTTTTTTLDS
jgi:hypothetical protein